MKNRYNRVVYKGEGGKMFCFEPLDPKRKEFIIYEGQKTGEMIIRAIERTYSEKYVNPPIPRGYKHVLGTWNMGFVIERCSDKSWFTWVPVGDLDSNGTLDGSNFNEKFGRRALVEENLYLDYDEDFLCEESVNQLESVRKYGGFYISTFAISIGTDDKKPHSIKGEKPAVMISSVDAYSIASEFENKNGVTSHLPYGAEYDSILSWFLKTSQVSLTDLKVGYDQLGNFKSFKVVTTGSYDSWCNKNIYDFFGNVEEWTQEMYYNHTDYSTCSVVRGGSAFSTHSVAERTPLDDYAESEDVGFRIALCISPNAKVSHNNYNS